MPWTKKQERLFRAAEHDPAIAREHGLSPRRAGDLADEAARLRKAEPPRPGVIDLTPVLGEPKRP